MAQYTLFVVSREVLEDPPYHPVVVGEPLVFIKSLIGAHKLIAAHVNPLIKLKLFYVNILK